MRAPAVLSLGGQVGKLEDHNYVIEKDEEMSPDDLANGLGRTVAQLKTRLAFGYVRTFVRGGDPFPRGRGEALMRDLTAPR